MCGERGGAAKNPKRVHDHTSRVTREMLRVALRRVATAAGREPTFPALLRLSLPGSLAAWEAAGFARNGDDDDMALSIGGVDLGVGGGDAVRLPSWGWRDGPRTRRLASSTDHPPCWGGMGSDHFIEVNVAGVATSIDDLDDSENAEHQALRASVAVPHPNGALGLYSLCVTTPDFEGTISALQQSGLALRRVRRPDDATSGGRPMAFFKFGAPPGRDVILELVGPGASDGAAKAMEHMGFSMGEHAMIAGLVVEVPSISPIARLLGLQLLGAERDAAQGHGRRIAPLKHKAAGLPLPLAFITPSTGSQ